MSWNPLKHRSVPKPVHPRRQRCSALPELECLEDRRLLSTSVTTYHNNLTRTGANLTETTLTPSNVNMSTFGKLFSYPVDGQVYAQPLYMAGVTLPDGSIHNIVYVVTMNDSAYAFDANNPTAGPNGNGVLWQRSFIDPANGITTISSDDLGTIITGPQVGITDTPVIDPNTGIMYFVAATKVTASDGSVSFHQTLHALDIKTGHEALGGPVEIKAADLGHGDGGNSLLFNPRRQLERNGLVLANGVVYTTWSSHSDQTPVHGWIIGYDAQTLVQVVVFNTSPNAQLASLWGGAPAVDANGNLYAVTGNGSFPQGGDYNPSLGDYPETVLKLSPATGQLTVADYFTPFNENALDIVDEDLGSGSAMLLPDQTGPITHLMVVAGKEGKLYLINRDNMGQFDPNQDHVVQEVSNAILGQGAYDSPAYFDAGTPNNRWIYFAGWNDSLRAFQLLDNGSLSTTSTSQSAHIFVGLHGAEPSISANGTTNAIVWAIDPVAGGAVLYAFDATNVANELYDSSQAGSRDQLDGGVKFTVPTIADGQVYVGTTDSLTVFGLLPGAAAPRERPPGSLLDPGAVLLLASLTSRDTPGSASRILSSGAVQTSSPLPSLPVLAPLIGSPERVATDIVFAGNNQEMKQLGSVGQLAAHPFDLLAVDPLGASLESV